MDSTKLMISDNAGVKKSIVIHLNVTYRTAFHLGEKKNNLTSSLEFDSWGICGVDIDIKTPEIFSYNISEKKLPSSLDNISRLVSDTDYLGNSFFPSLLSWTGQLKAMWNDPGTTNCLPITIHCDCSVSSLEKQK